MLVNQIQQDFFDVHCSGLQAMLRHDFHGNDALSVKDFVWWLGQRPRYITVSPDTIYNILACRAPLHANRISLFFEYIRIRANETGDYELARRYANYYARMLDYTATPRKEDDDSEILNIAIKAIEEIRSRKNGGSA